MAINPSKLFRISVRPVMIKIFATPDSSPNTVAAALRLCFESFRRLPNSGFPQKNQKRPNEWPGRKQWYDQEVAHLLQPYQHQKNQLPQLHAVPGRKTSDYLVFHKPCFEISGYDSKSCCVVCDVAHTMLYL